MNTSPKDKKQTGRQAREQSVLLALIAHYISTGKPVGSKTLKQTEFDNLSSATLRNYFATLEKQGFLTQQHVSGGRLPTDKGYRVYANNSPKGGVTKKDREEIDTLRLSDSPQAHLFLQQAAELLSEQSDCAVFYSSPRFEQDFITTIKLVPLDHSRSLAILFTNYGRVRTEIVQTPHKLSAFTIHRMELYFAWCLTGKEPDESLEEREKPLAEQIYNELMMRSIVDLANSGKEPIHKLGFSKLLNYPELHDTKDLSQALALFENEEELCRLCAEVETKEAPFCWIGDDLLPYTKGAVNCSVIAVPYCVHQQKVGTLGILGATRLPYPKLFSLLEELSTCVSDVLTKNLYKFKISYRKTEKGSFYDQTDTSHLIESSHLFLLEDKTPG